MTTEVFDVAAWLDRANGRAQEAGVGFSAFRSAPRVEETRIDSYVPRHRADVPVDHVA